MAAPTPTVPACIEIIPGSLYLAAPGESNLSDLKPQLQKHILAHRAQQASTPKAGRRIPLLPVEPSSPAAASASPLTPTAATASGAAASPEPSALDVSASPATPLATAAATPSTPTSAAAVASVDSDESALQHRAPVHGSHTVAPAPPCTPGFHVSLMPTASPLVTAASNSSAAASTPVLNDYQQQKVAIKLLSIDSQFVYNAISQDFGPFSLGQVVRFVRGLAGLLRQSGVDAVVCYCKDTPRSRLNAAFLVGAFLVWHHQRTADAVGAALGEFVGALHRFRDASNVEEQHDISLHDCLRALAAVAALKIFSLSSFNLNEYEYYSSFDNGDISVIVPGKLIAFSGPSDSDPAARFSPVHYCDVFRALGVSHIVRLNFPEYAPKPFNDAGFRHIDMYFPDGCAPSMSVAAHFLEIVERAPGIVAVHCRAGLGRTGTCIALYLMKHFGFNAAEATAWVRICRPGSIVGGQYHFLVRAYPLLIEERRNDAILMAAAQRERAAEQHRVMQMYERHHMQQQQLLQQQQQQQEQQALNESPVTQEQLPLPLPLPQQQQQQQQPEQLPAPSQAPPQ